MWFSGRANLDRLQAIDITIRLGHVDIEPADCDRDLGVLLDNSLSDIDMFFIFDGSASSVVYDMIRYDTVD